MFLLASCGEQDPCPHPVSLVLDFRRDTADSAWTLVDPKAPGAPLAGELASLSAGPEGRVVAAGWLRDDAGPSLWAAELDERVCVRRAWRAPLGGDGPKPATILALSDGGLLAGGTAPGPGSDNDEAWVARYDNLGRAAWSVDEGEFLYVSGLFETPSREQVTALAALPDGRVAAAGGADVNGALHSNWLMLLEADGRVRGRIDLPRDDPRTAGDLAAIVPQADGVLWLAGTLDPGAPEADAWVLAIADDGATLLWDRRYEAAGRQSVADALPLDGGLLLAGGDAGEAWFATLDAEGEMLGSQRLRRAQPRGELRDLAAAGGTILAAGTAGGPWLLRLDARGIPGGTGWLAGSGRLLSALALPDGAALGGGRLGSAGPPLLVRLEPE